MKTTRSLRVRFNFWIRIMFVCLCAYQFFSMGNIPAHQMHPSDISISDRPSEQLMLLAAIPNHELGRMDYFSDSWLVNRNTFLKIDASRIVTVEDACFFVIDGESHENKKMTLDWTDFQVEHMSKWWKNMQVMVHIEPFMFQQLISIFEHYLQNVLKSTRRTKIPSVMQDAIAMIAFQSYESTKFGPERGYRVTAYSLASTIASLYRAGFGRVVVAGYHPSDQDRVKDAFKILDSTFSSSWGRGRNSSDQEHMERKIGATELTYVKLEESWVKTSRVPINVPRGALMGMKLALEQNNHAWLGKDRWKYFYLTEPDTILNTKPRVLPLVVDGLDKGFSFFPHRLQPLPHEFNLPRNHTFMNTGRYLPNSVAPFSNISALENPWNKGNSPGPNNGMSYSHCCDIGKFKPGRSEKFGTKQKPCGKWWWGCGFSNSNKPLSNQEVLDLHKRLLDYPMMILQGGTGVVFASTEMGRRCFPSKAPCVLAT